MGRGSAGCSTHFHSRVGIHTNWTLPSCPYPTFFSAADAELEGGSIRMTLQVHQPCSHLDGAHSIAITSKTSQIEFQLYSDIANFSARVSSFPVGNHRPVLLYKFWPSQLSTQMLRFSFIRHQKHCSTFEFQNHVQFNCRFQSSGSSLRLEPVYNCNCVYVIIIKVHFTIFHFEVCVSRQSFGSQCDNAQISRGTIIF